MATLLSRLAVVLTIVTQGYVGHAFGPREPVVLAPGDLRAALVEGPVYRAGQAGVDVDGFFRVGVASRLEIAFPLALNLEVLRISPGTSIMLGGGVVDMYLPLFEQILYMPAVFITAPVLLGPEARMVFSMDLMAVERLPAKSPHSAWLRGGLALGLDFGPYLTVAGGITYQRIVIDNGLLEYTTMSGAVGNARISLGGVRVHPFYDLPTIAVHMYQLFDLVGIFRLDVDLDSRTSDARFLFGVVFKN